MFDVLKEFEVTVNGKMLKGLEEPVELEALKGEGETS